MKILYTILIFDLALLCGVNGQTAPTSAPPLPPTYEPTASMDSAPAPDSGGFVGGTETNIVLTSSAEWELSFVWSHDLAFTNNTVYPIAIQVPFEHDNGFIRIVARKVEVE